MAMDNSMEKIQIVKLRKISLLVEDIKQKFCFRFICACQVSAHLVNMLYHVFLVHDLPVNLLMCHWCFYYFTLLWLVYCLFKMFFLYLLNQKGFCCRLSCCILQTVIFIQVQKQPPVLFYEKRCSQKFRRIHRKTSVPESRF